jgi:splicing factor 1
MARDCPDRQRGANWRGGDERGPGRPAPRVGAGDAVDREYESLMQELSGGAPNAGPQHRIEADLSGYENAGQDSNSSLPPWQRGATGGPAPWSRSRDDRDGGSGGAPPWAAGRGAGGPPPGGDNYGYQSGGYAAAPPPPGGAAPWQHTAPPPPPGGQS